MSVLEPHLPFAENISRRPTPWTSLPGWTTESFEGFWEGLASSQQYFATFQTASTQAWQAALARFDSIDLKTPDDIRAFFKEHFNVFENITPPDESSRFTGYYEPVVAASRTYQPTYPVPIYRRPPELLVIEDLGYFRASFKGHRIAGIPQNGTLVPFYKSQDIWTGALANQNLEIAWASSAVDVFFMHVQGSGKLNFDDGTEAHITYDGTNGYPYTALGKVLKEKGLLTPSQQNMQGIRDVLHQNQEHLYDLLSCNESYVFFKELTDNRPYNRLGTPLIAGRSVAVDPLYVPLGSLLWIDTPPYQGLRFAHDVGAAIKGPVRADLFCGQGMVAGNEAGSLNQPGRLFVILPK